MGYIYIYQLLNNPLRINMEGVNHLKSSGTSIFNDINTIAWTYSDEDPFEQR